MQKDESDFQLQARVTVLEAELQRIYKRRKLWRQGGVAVGVLCVGVSVFAQVQPETLGMLLSRIGKLEDRVTKLETRVTHDEVGSTNFPSPEDSSGGDKSTQQQLSAVLKAFHQLQDEIHTGRGGSGAVVVAPFHVVDEKGQLIFSVESMAEGASVYGKDGAFAKIGPNPAGAMGVRVYGANTTLASAGMVLRAGNIGIMFVGSSGKNLAQMGVVGGVGDVAVMDDKGTSLSDLTRYPGGGGALKIANASGQMVSIIDANPANSEGRAIFTDGGGQPLAKIGAAGNHGDVLLGGEGKGFELWGRMIAGLP